MPLLYILYYYLEDYNFEKNEVFLSHHKNSLFFYSAGCINMPQDSQELSTKQYMTKLYIVVFLYQCANALLLPIMPYFANSLNANVTEYGLVFTVYYIAQLISLFHSIELFLGSLSFGGVGDKYGRRIAVCVPLLGLAICIAFKSCQF